MKKRMFIFILMILFAFGAVYAQRGSARGETVQIRFASPLPRNSEFGRILDRLAADWARVTNNAVNVVVSHDAREGSEANMLTSLSNNAIQVALFSSSGVSEICPAVVTLSVPFLIKDNRELDLVLNDIVPVLNTKVNNDFVVVAWSKGGWMYIYSKEAVLTPADLRRQRLASSTELRDMNLAFRSMGFNVIEVDMFNLGPRLANNTVNTIYMIPTAVAPLQLHRHLNNMLEMPIGPVMGAIVMNRVTWNRLTSEQQQAIITVTQRSVNEFNSSLPRAETDAIQAMARGGLSVNRPTPAQESLWKTELDDSINSLLGTVFDREIYQRINNILARLRSGS
jgi:TRAP-type C4-dicarboxylate transport system substrate-binding protein